MLAMGRPEFEAWKLVPGEKVSLNLEDRGFKFEAVTTCLGLDQAEGLSACALELPRSLRRADSHRLVDFAPDRELPRATFSNARNALLEGQVTGFGREGLELSLADYVSFLKFWQHHQDQFCQSEYFDFLIMGFLHQGNQIRHLEV